MKYVINLSYFGFVVGASLLIGIFSGHLQTNIHGFGIIMFLQAIWMMACGVWLIKDDNKCCENT